MPIRKATSNETKDFYSLIPKEMKQTLPNPDYDQHGIELPFRGLIVAASGGGKTTLVLEILSRMPRTFDQVCIVCRSKAEPLYEFLEAKSDPDTLSFFEYASDGLPTLDTFTGPGQKLIVFDDLISLSKRELEPVVDMFIRGRKQGCSMLFLTQSYYKTPRTIRLQCNYIFLKKLGSTRDINMILSDTSLGLSREQLYNIYRRCTRKKGDFLMIRLDKDEADGRFSHNFLECI